VEVVRSVTALRASAVGTSDGSPQPRGAVTFGNFDGVHLGHRALITTLRSAAARSSGPAVVVTFDPHPLHTLAPDRAPPAIDTLDGRLDWLAKAGVDRTAVLRFDESMRDRSAHWFAENVLFACGPATVVAGYDASFGRGGGGDIDLLRGLGVDRGITVEGFDAVVAEGDVVSSSRIRALVSSGDIATAARLLDRPFALRGPVVRGDALGRTIGFPTANIDASSQVRPANGVYAARLVVDGVGHDAVCNIGVRPTVSDGLQWRTEAFIFDFDADIYGQHVSLQLIARLRGERRFDGIDALKAQIARDCEAARKVMAGVQAEDSSPR